MSYWYIARHNELLIDLDDYTRPTRSGAPWGEVFFRRRLRDAMLDGKLDVQNVYLSRSNTSGHFHAFVRINQNGKHIGQIQRLVWQLHLGSDLYRGRADLMRAAKDMAYPSLLITSKKLRGFWRSYDDRCSCKQKHITGKSECPVWKHYRGMSPWELFGESHNEEEKFIALPLGHVPIDLILKKEGKGS